MKYSIKDQFEAAVCVIQNLPKNGTFQPSTSLMLLFYSYYKQARNGTCRSQRPPFYDPVGQSKWDAWKGLGSMSAEEAMKHYVAELKKIAEIMPQSKEVESFIEKIGGIYEMVDEEEEEDEEKIGFNLENNGGKDNDTNGDNGGSKGEDNLRSITFKNGPKSVNEDFQPKSTKSNNKGSKPNTKRNNSKKKNRVANPSTDSYNSKKKDIFEELDKELEKELLKKQFNADYEGSIILKKQVRECDINEGDRTILNNDGVNTKQKPITNDDSINNKTILDTKTTTTNNNKKTSLKNDSTANETSVTTETTNATIDPRRNRVLSDCCSSNDEFLDTFEFLDSQPPGDVKSVAGKTCVSSGMRNGVGSVSVSSRQNNGGKSQDNDVDDSDKKNDGNNKNDDGNRGLRANDGELHDNAIKSQGGNVKSKLAVATNSEHHNTIMKPQENTAPTNPEPSTSSAPTSSPSTSAASYNKSKGKNKSVLNLKTNMNRQDFLEENKESKTYDTLSLVDSEDLNRVESENLNTTKSGIGTQIHNIDEMKGVLLILQSSLDRLRNEVKDLNTAVKDLQEVKSLLTYFPSIPTTIFIIVWPIIVNIIFKYFRSKR